MSTEKDAGVNITNSLTWNTHIQAIIAKANKLLGLLKCTCPLLRNGPDKNDSNNGNEHVAIQLVFLLSVFTSDWLKQQTVNKTS